MRRLNQLVASILFVTCVLSIYLLFDYAVNRVVREKHVQRVLINRTLPSRIIPHERIARPKKTTRPAAKSAQQFHKSKTGIKMNHKKQVVKLARNKTSTKG